MSNFFILLCYIITAYGACNVIAFGDGPFKIFALLREYVSNISEHFGKALSCMMCLPANFGWLCSLFNWFVVPISFTPFNIIFNDYDNLWWIAALCDGAFTSGIVYLIYIINEYIEKKIDLYEQNTYKNENNVYGYDSADIDENMFIVEDITNK